MERVAIYDKRTGELWCPDCWLVECQNMSTDEQDQQMAEFNGPMPRFRVRDGMTCCACRAVVNDGDWEPVCEECGEVAADVTIHFQGDATSLTSLCWGCFAPLAAEVMLVAD